MHPHAIISGGSSGIGLALAERLAAAGYHVSILARGAASLEAARVALEARRRDVTQIISALTADVADAAATEGAVLQAIATAGPPDLVIANAGMVAPGLFASLPYDAFRRTMEVNYFGVLHLIRATLPAMRERRTGRVVLVSSGAGLIGLYGYTSYAPSKFAVRGLAEALRAELRPDGVGVSVVYPPDTDTPQLREEIRIRPKATSEIAGGAKPLSAGKVADAILQGVTRGRFVIAPGLEMAALARLHSLLAPLLNRFWFDKVVARRHESPPLRPR